MDSVHELLDRTIDRVERLAGEKRTTPAGETRTTPAGETRTTPAKPPDPEFLARLRRLVERIACLGTVYAKSDTMILYSTMDPVTGMYDPDGVMIGDLKRALAELERFA